MRCALKLLLRLIVRYAFILFLVEFGTTVTCEIGEVDAEGNDLVEG